MSRQSAAWLIDYGKLNERRLTGNSQGREEPRVDIYSYSSISKIGSKKPEHSINTSASFQDNKLQAS